MKLIIKTSKHKQVVDITERLEKELPAKKHGVAFVFIKHTTAAISTADLDPGTDLDMLDAFEAMIPKLEFRHPHNPEHVGDHIMSSIIGSSLAIPFDSGKLDLGTWQRAVLIELDGPREREIRIDLIFN
jgi:secondary thiamine-phosphate synthase enzyme